MSRYSLALRLSAALWLLAGSGGARAQIRIPAIDPTGERIFSGTTTLAPHDLLHCPLLETHNDKAVVPVAAPAPVKPPCTPPVEVVPVVTQPPVAIPVAPPRPVVPVMPVTCPQPAAGPPPLTIAEPPCPEPPGPELKVTPSRIVAPVNTE